jgi:hypothetical protein
MARPRKVVSETTAPIQTPVTEAPATIKTVVAEQKPTAKVKAKPYFLGTTDECPYWNLTLSGITFHRETAELIAGKRGQDDILVQGPPVRGHIELLTPDMIERIKKAARTKVVRWLYPPRWEEVVDVTDGTKRKVFKGNGRIYSSSPRGPDAPQFEPQENDEPIGKYVYCMDVSTMEPSEILGDRRNVQVKTLHEAMEDGTL